MCVCVCVCVCEISGIRVILLDTLLITDTHSHVENSELCNAVMQHTCVQQQKREREKFCTENHTHPTGGERSCDRGQRSNPHQHQNHHQLIM